MSHSLIQSPTAAVLKCPECGFEITNAVLQLVRQHEPNYKTVFEACLAQNKHLRQTIEGAMGNYKIFSGPLEATDAHSVKLDETAATFKQLDYKNAFEGALAEVRRLKQHVADLSEELKQAQERCEYHVEIDPFE